MMGQSCKGCGDKKPYDPRIQGGLQEEAREAGKARDQLYRRLLKRQIQGVSAKLQTKQTREWCLLITFCCDYAV